MSNIVGKYNLKPAVTGDTWDGAALTISTDGVPDNLTGFTIQMFVEQPGSNTAIKTLTTVASGGITITNAAAGQFAIDDFIMDLPAGDYEYKIKLTSGAGRVKTRVVGTWKIIEL